MPQTKKKFYSFLFEKEYLFRSVSWFVRPFFFLQVFLTLLVFIMDPIDNLKLPKYLGAKGMHGTKKIITLF
jgi:hypothetical protein